MTVAAIIPHWNRRDLLEPLFASLRAQTLPFDEIILVDNGSTDGSADLAESLGARVLRQETNSGFAAAVNRGIASTSADWIAILNNDVTLAPSWLQQLAGTPAHFATGKILSSADHSILDGSFDEISRGACAWRCGAGRIDSPLWNQRRAIRIAPMTAAIFRSISFSGSRRPGRKLRILFGGCRFRHPLLPCRVPWHVYPVGHRLSSGQRDLRCVE